MLALSLASKVHRIPAPTRLALLALLLAGVAIVIVKASTNGSLSAARLHLQQAQTTFKVLVPPLTRRSEYGVPIAAAIGLLALASLLLYRRLARLAATPIVVAVFAGQLFSLRTPGYARTSSAKPGRPRQVGHESKLSGHGGSLIREQGIRDSADTELRIAAKTARSETAAELAALVQIARYGNSDSLTANDASQAEELASRIADDPAEPV